jgi:hypothetical protein
VHNKKKQGSALLVNQLPLMKVMGTLSPTFTIHRLATCTAPVCELEPDEDKTAEAVRNKIRPNIVSDSRYEVVKFSSAVNGLRLGVRIA